MTDAPSLTSSTRIAASPSDIFPYFTDPQLFVQWIGTSAELEPEPGGIFALDFTGTRVRGTFVAVEPPERVVFTWGIPGDAVMPAGSTTVEIRLIADGNDTIVELRHYDLPESQIGPHTEGWAEFLPILRRTAEAR